MVQMRFSAPAGCLSSGSVGYTNRTRHIPPPRPLPALPSPYFLQDWQWVNLKLMRSCPNYCYRPSHQFRFRLMPGRPICQSWARTELFPTSGGLDFPVLLFICSLCFLPLKDLIFWAFSLVFLIYFYINFLAWKELILVYFIYLYLISFLCFHNSIYPR